MTIETKYNIGQEVWCQTRTGVGCAKIYSIEIDDTYLMYYLEGEDIEGWYFEYELYPTKEELLKSCSMKVKELRLGNIVSIKDHFVGGNAVVTGIMCDRITAVNSVGTNIDTINIMYVEPIPINAELLLKIGLLKSTYSEKIFKIEGEKCELIYYVEGTVLDICSDTNRASITCKYLHQLQNAYYLVTGKELEIKL